MLAYLTDAHEHLRQQVRQFAEAEVAPRVQQMDLSGQVEEDLPWLIARQGWIGVTIEAAYGGMDAGHVAKTVVIEELSQISPAMGAAAQASLLGTAKINHFGSEEQKQQWLPQIADGSCLPTIAITEAGCGSDILSMQATAERKGGDYVLNGRKVFIGNSHIGTLHGVVARTGESDKRPLSAFLVEADRPGLRVAPHIPTMSLRGFSFGELIFDNCRIPTRNRLGDEGDGYDVAQSSSVLYGRPNLAAVSLGIHQALMDQTSRFVTERKRYGGPLHELDTIRHKVGNMRQRLMTARRELYHAVSQLDHGLPCDEDLYSSKYLNVESAQKSATDAMKIHAGVALQTNRPLERFFRDAWGPWSAAGTSDVQLHRLGQVAVGLYRDQWSQRFARRHPSISTNCHAPSDA